MWKNHNPTLPHAYNNGQTETTRCGLLSFSYIGFLFSRMASSLVTGRVPAGWGTLCRVAGMAAGGVWGAWERKIPGSQGCAVGLVTQPSWKSWHAWCFGILGLPIRVKQKANHSKLSVRDCEKWDGERVQPTFWISFLSDSKTSLNWEGKSAFWHWYASDTNCKFKGFPRLVSVIR